SAKANTGDGTAKVYPGNLADVTAAYTSLRLDKQDPYRLRFGELLGLTPAELSAADPGFFAYAAADAAAVRRLYPALTQAASELMAQHGYNRRATRCDIRPDALTEFGYLSEVIQVQASVVLARMLRRGVRVDVAKARALEAQYRAE